MKYALILLSFAALASGQPPLTPAFKFVGASGQGITSETAPAFRSMLGFPTPTVDAQFPVWSQTAQRFIPLTLTGAVTVSNSGVVSIAPTALKTINGQSLLGLPGGNLTISGGTGTGGANLATGPVLSNGADSSFAFELLTFLAATDVGPVLDSKLTADAGKLLFTSATTSAQFAGANFTVSAASRGVLYTTTQFITITLPSGASAPLAGLKFRVQVDNVPSVDFAGASLLERDSYDAVPQLFVDDGLCEIENVAGNWILTRGAVRDLPPFRVQGTALVEADATFAPTANKVVKRNSEGTARVSKLEVSNGIEAVPPGIVSGGSAGSANENAILSGYPGYVALTGNTDGTPNQLRQGTISGATSVFGDTTWSYQGAAATAHLSGLGATTLGQNIFRAPNQNSIRFPRVNSDSTVSWLTATETRNALGVSGTLPTGSVGGQFPVYDVATGQFQSRLMSGAVTMTSTGVTALNQAGFRTVGGQSIFGAGDIPVNGGSNQLILLPSELHAGFTSWVSPAVPGVRGAAYMRRGSTDWNLFIYNENETAIIYYAAVTSAAATPFGLTFDAPATGSGVARVAPSNGPADGTAIMIIDGIVSPTVSDTEGLGGIAVTGNLTRDGTDPVVFPSVIYPATVLSGRLSYFLIEGTEEFGAVYNSQTTALGTITGWYLQEDSEGGKWVSSADVLTPDLVPAGAWDATTNPNGWRPVPPSTGTPAVRAIQGAGRSNLTGGPVRSSGGISSIGANALDVEMVNGLQATLSTLANVQLSNTFTNRTTFADGISLPEPSPLIFSNDAGQAWRSALRLESNGLLFEDVGPNGAPETLNVRGFKIWPSGNFRGNLTTQSLTAQRFWTLPNASGDILLANGNGSALTNLSTANLSGNISRGLINTALNANPAPGTFTTLTATEVRYPSGSTFVYGEGSAQSAAITAAAHRTALNLASTSNAQFGSVLAAVGSFPTTLQTSNLVIANGSNTSITFENSVGDISPIQGFYTAVRSDSRYVQKADPVLINATVSGDLVTTGNASVGGTLTADTIVSPQLSVMEDNIEAMTLSKAELGAENQRFTGDNEFDLVPRTPFQDLGADGANLSNGRKYFRSVSTNQQFIFSDAPVPGASITLKLRVTNAPTISFPSSKRIGTADTAITSLVLTNGNHQLTWTYTAGEWLLFDTVDDFEAATAVAGTTGTFSSDLSFGGVLKYGSGQFVTEGGASRTLTAGDHGKTIICTSPDPVTLTHNAGLPAYFFVNILQKGAGVVTVSGSATREIVAGYAAKTSGLHSQIHLANYGVLDTYQVGGNLGL